MTWYLFALTAAVFFAIYFLIFHKYIHREHAVEYLAIMSIFLVLFSFPLTKEITFDLGAVTWAMLYLISLLLTVFFYFIALSFKHLESSEAVPFMNISLLFVVIFSVIFLKEVVTLRNLLGVGLMIVGSYILEIGIKIDKIKKVIKRFKRKYVLYTLFATIAASIIIIFEKILLNPEVVGAPIDPVSPASLYFLTRAGMAINFLVILFVRKHSFTGINHALSTMVLPILVTAVFNIAANYTHYLALQIGQVSLVAPISALSSLIVIIIGGELFHEHKLQQKMIAALLMILATYLIIV